MAKVCKLCGAEIHNIENYVHSEHKGYTCGDCGSYCMKKCKLPAISLPSWHREPCVSCKHNPYHIQHKWDGKEWVKK